MILLHILPVRHSVRKTVDLTFVIFLALVSVSEEVRSRCHVKHTIPRWSMESTVEQTQDGGAQSVRRQKSWDMLDQSAISYARQQQHKAPHQVTYVAPIDHWIFFPLMI